MIYALAPSGIPTTSAALFNGVNSYIQVPDSPSLRVGSGFTFSAWIDPLSTAACGSSTAPTCIIFNKESSYEWALDSSGQLCWAIDNTNPGWSWSCTTEYVGTDSLSHVALTYDGTAVVSYFDGIVANTISASGSVSDSGHYALRIGARGAPGAASSFFNGEISNVQIYSSALSSPQVGSLYASGISGAPIPGEGIAGWWPLDGNADDYSNNGNNGAATNVIFTRVAGTVTDSLSSSNYYDLYPLPGISSCESMATCYNASMHNIWLSNYPILFNGSVQGVWQAMGLGASPG